jgi:hypothetical protein
MADPTPDPDSSAPPPRRGLTRAQWQLLAIGVLMMVPPVLFVIIILVLNFAR